MKKRREFRMSLLLRWYVGIMLLVMIGIVIWLNAFVLRNLEASERQREIDVLEGWGRVWDGILATNTAYIDNFLSNNSDVSRLAAVKKQGQILYTLQDIRADLESYALLDAGMNEVFFCDPDLGDIGILTVHDEKTRTLEPAVVRVSGLIRLYDSDEQVRSWKVLENSGGRILMYLSEQSGYYAGCWCYMDTLVGPDVLNRPEEVIELVASGIAPDQTKISFPADPGRAGPAADQDSYDVYVRESKTAQLSYIAFVEQSAARTQVKYIRNIMILMTIVLVVVLIVLSGVLERFLYQPIRQLVVRMQEIADGHFESRMTQTPVIREIRVLGDTFNEMADEIGHLKIRVYEDQLEAQKVRMQYLQLQVKPHFLVNGLNSVYAMIDMDDPEGAKQMCRHLADYFRFLYTKNTEMVTLSDELEHVSNYMSIQQMRRPGKVHFHIEIDPDIRSWLLPPLSIQTFVENSFKYGINRTSQQHEITVTARPLDASDEERKARLHGVVIEIRDTGEGFPEAVLQAIQDSAAIFDGDRICVGMTNTIDRLHLFYGDRARVRLINDGGAAVRLTLTVQE